MRLKIKQLGLRRFWSMFPLTSRKRPTLPWPRLTDAQAAAVKSYSKLRQEGAGLCPVCWHLPCSPVASLVGWVFLSISLQTNQRWGSLKKRTPSWSPGAFLENPQDEQRMLRVLAEASSRRFGKESLSLLFLRGLSRKMGRDLCQRKLIAFEAHSKPG